MGDAVIAEMLHKVEAGGDLSRAEAEAVMEELLEGRLAQAEIVGLLTTLRAKGETVDELVGFARAMRRHVRPVNFGAIGAGCGGLAGRIAAGGYRAARAATTAGRSTFRRRRRL